MEMITLTIDGKKVEVAKGSTILTAAQKLGIRIPTLCYHPELSLEGACRVCVVEVEGARGLVASCVFPAAEGMVVKTNTPVVREGRKMVVELLLANHPQDCLTCQRNLNCELQRMALEMGIREQRFEGEKKHYAKDLSNLSLVRDQDKCILCGRCVRVCAEKQGAHVYSFTDRGFNTKVVPAFDRGLGEAACVLCGQCANVCPVGAIMEVDDTEKVWAALGDPTKHVVVQTAPAIRVALGEDLGIGPGSIVTGKMVSALRMLGFDKVFDTDFTADLTILEEGNEFLQRLQNRGTMPMLTSCSPGWVNFMEINYPDLLDHLSTAKSPQQMFGALVKTYYAEKFGVDPKNIVSVSIMPCVAKKTEAARPEMRSSGYQDVDYVLTTRELARMIGSAGIDFKKLPEEEFDAPMGIATGAGVIFGTTGGVMEAAIRTVHAVVLGKEMPQLDFHAARGMEGIKEAVVDLEGTKVKIAVVHALSNARILMDKIRKGEADYHFVEVMACPGGCIGGGGQPYCCDNPAEVRQQRSDAIYSADQLSKLRQAHLNPAVKELYEDWLGEPLGKKSHHLLHTHYHKQDKV